MTGDNLRFWSGTYPDSGDAAADFETLKSAEAAGEY